MKNDFKFRASHEIEVSSFFILHSSFDLVKPIYKLFYWIYRPASSLWYWARRRFTLAGLCVAGGFIVAGAVGTDIENTVTYQIVCAAAGVFAFGIRLQPFSSAPNFPRRAFCRASAPPGSRCIIACR